MERLASTGFYPQEY